MRAGFLFLITLAAAHAQYPGGGYPGGGYPGQSPYPGGGGGMPRIPMPRGKAKDPKASPNQPLPNFRGKLKQVDAKSITLELDDNRVLDFKRTDKTKFFKGGDEVKSSIFAAGDQISVEGPQDQEGYLVAVNVYWEKSATAAAKSDKDSGVADAWKDAPAKDAPAADTAAQEHATGQAPPPAKPDPLDPGPPTLRRGKPADSAREHAAPVPEQPKLPNPPARPPDQVADAAPPPSIARPPTANVPAEAGSSASAAAAPSAGEEIGALQRPMDPLIRKSSEEALNFTESLPNYTCQEMMSRYQSESHPANWQPIDIVSANVVYENGKEDYRDIAVNGKPVKKKIEEIGGAWSTGEFGTLLIDLFSPATDAHFQSRGTSRVAGINAKKYDFDVARETSHWTVHMASQTYSPAYRGSVWIDPATSRVLRIEMLAYGFPDEFPTDHVESATDYEYIRLGDLKQYLLPVHAETLSCQRGSERCSRNTIDFRNYHKYSGESNIQFDDVKPDPVTKDPPKTTPKKK